MYTNTRISIVVAFTNIIFSYLALSLYFLLLNDKIDILVFQFFYFPLIIGLINLFLWFQNYKMEFYQHWIYIYLGFFSSVFIYLIIQYIKNIIKGTPEDFPPGEANFDLLLFLSIFISLQLIVLLLLNVVTYAFIRLFAVYFKKL